MLVAPYSLFSARRFIQLRFKIDNVVSNIKPMENGNNALFILKNFPGGIHKFKLLNTPINYPCDLIEKNINNSTALKFNCGPNPN